MMHRESSFMMAWILMGIGVAGLSMVMWPAQAEGETTERDGKILHRYFDAEDWLRSDGDEQSRQGEGSEEEGLGGATSEPIPSRRQADAGAGMWLSPGQQEWIWTPDGPVGPEAIESPHGSVHDGGMDTPLDSATDEVDELSYQSSFEPSVVPFKRGRAQQEIRRRAGGQTVAALDQGELRPVEVGGELEAGEERFVGSFLMRFEPGVPQPVASVAPTQRVLGLETEPNMALDVRRDDADNFYLVSATDEVVRVNMEIAVERFYFDGAINPTVEWSQVDTMGVSLDDGALSQEAQEVLEVIGIARESHQPQEALSRLVEYHRSFAFEAAPDIEAGDEYRQISLRQVGVCRHRALTFMISARELGFESRYVFNEAHAFVEVNWPGQGWRRIDLGGAADALNYGGSAGGTIHDGHEDQGFPRPESYEEEMAGMRGDAGADREAEQSEGELSEVDEMLSAEELPPEVSDEVESEIASDGQESVRAAEVTRAEGELFRGRKIYVAGNVEAGEGGQEVAVYLRPSGSSDASQRVKLGRTGIEGPGFGDEFRIPADLGLGRWSLEAEVVD